MFWKLWFLQSGNELKSGYIFHPYNFEMHAVKVENLESIENMISIWIYLSLTYDQLYSLHPQKVEAGRGAET